MKLKHDTPKAALAAVQNILRLCKLSGTVKRVIYTGSVTAASPLKEDGTGYEDFIDEACWTPLNLSFAHCEVSTPKWGQRQWQNRAAKEAEGWSSCQV